MSNATSKVMYEYTNTGEYVPENVTHVRFHPSVVKVDNEAFCRRDKLIEVVLNNGLREIGNAAFFGCISLQSINIPSTVIKIGSGAFNGCNSLREAVLDEGLQKIGRAAFRECKLLETINFPSTVTEIGMLAFNNCTNLRDVVLNDGLNEVGERAFDCCKSLQSVILSSTVTKIGIYSFWGCTRLRGVVIHNEGVQIGDRSFNNCLSLERYKFPGLSTRLDNIIQAGQRGIEAKMDDIPAVEWRDGELIIPAVISRQREDAIWGMGTLVEVDKEKLIKVEGLIAYYEMKEATTLFELALWKTRIDQADISNPPDREACRMEVPGPVKDTIMQYLN